MLDAQTLKTTSGKATAGEQHRIMEFDAFLADDSYAGKKTMSVTEILTRSSKGVAEKMAEEPSGI